MRLAGENGPSVGFWMIVPFSTRAAKTVTWSGPRPRFAAEGLDRLPPSRLGLGKLRWLRGSGTFPFAEG